MAPGTEASGSATATRLYYNSSTLEFTAKVTDIRLVATETGEAGVRSHVWQIALDRTAFYPESGGQPWDTGVLVATARSGATLEVPVERVIEDEAGEVWHQIRKPLEQGTEIAGRVEAERRRDHTQQHSGQHLLSAVFLERLGARTVSFHLGAESATIDLALPEGTAGLTADQLAEVEDAANRLIYDNRAITPRWHTRAEAEAMLARGELRKLPERSGPMRVLEMQGVEFNACGGTHVASTGAIGGLLLRGTEKVKSGLRVEFVCGLRAIRMTRAEHGLVASVAGLLTVGASQVLERVSAMLGAAKANHKELQALTNDLADAEASLLDTKFLQGALIEALYLKKDLPFVKRVATGLAAKGRGAVLSVSSDRESGVLLVRPPDSGFHAGDLVKQFLQQEDPKGEARGGGTADIAQIVLKPGSENQIREGLAKLVKGLTAQNSQQN